MWFSTDFRERKKPKTSMEIRLRKWKNQGQASHQLPVTNECKKWIKGKQKQKLNKK